LLSRAHHRVGPAAGVLDQPAEAQVQAAGVAERELADAAQRGAQVTPWDREIGVDEIEDELGRGGEPAPEAEVAARRRDQHVVWMRGARDLEREVADPGVVAEASAVGG